MAKGASRLTSSSAEQLVLAGLAADNIFPRGEIFYVCDASVVRDGTVVGSSGNDGSFHAPFASIATAITNCTASRDDVIICLNNHTEVVTAAAGLAFSKAGITLWCPPTKNLAARASIEFTTATTADVDFSAATTVYNIRFINGIDSLAAPLDVDSADVGFIGCIFDDPTTTKRTLSWIDVAASSHRFKLIDPYTIGVGSITTVANKNNFVKITGACRDVEIAGGYIFGDYLSGAIQYATAACLSNYIHDIELNNTAAVALINDGNVANTGRVVNVTGSVGGSSSVALATAVFDESASLVTYCNTLASNDAKERAAATGTAST